MQTLVSSFKFERFENVWGKYYEEVITRPDYLEDKKDVIAAFFLRLSNIKTVIDVGGNNGKFTKMSAGGDRKIICADAEHFAVESLYRHLKTEQITNIIPLCIDFSNPSPAIGVNNIERSSFLHRASCDVAMALALVHHLAIGKNIPFSHLAEMFARLGKFLIIEFVAKEDEKVQLLLQHKKDIYDWYTEDAFLQAFLTRFKLIDKQPLTSSPRTLYLMERL